MTNHSGSAGSMPTDEPVANWEWIRDRLAKAEQARANCGGTRCEQAEREQSNREKFEDWLAAQLTLLEADYEECETHNSRTRDLRKEFSQSR